ncbi:NAD(P)H-dependent oxidoreductase [Arcobacter sp.]|uniref:NAD(P)H-dependent oxidoreductase n=1 Tax=unclassified Arcobacter TaxID=2593671 RepID=UPI003AFFC104
MIKEKTLIILSHPNLELSKFNKSLINGIKHLNNLTIRHLDSLYGSDTKAFDVEAEQNMLLEHERIIFQFPWYWYSSPAMIKAYQDEVLTYGFAYGNQGDKLFGKKFKIVTTIGGPDYSYQEGSWNKKSINELLSPFQVMASLTGMTYTKAFKVHGVAAMDDEELASKVKEYKEELLNESWDNGLTKYIRKINQETIKAK